MNIFNSPPDRPGDLCPCTEEPFQSPCCQWEDNDRACYCAEMGARESGQGYFPS